VPLVDRRTNSFVLRIVYDGPPEAGRATNLQQLCERLSLRQPSPADASHDRGLYLDWLDAAGERVGGPRVRCQLVNVPRQLQLARRGRTILDSADAVVFVADSRASAAPRTKAALRSLVRGLGNRPDVPLVLQANKQDLPGAQPPSDLHQALGLAARVPVVAAHASGGEGVVETFTLAVRAAVDHVRARLVAGELGEADAINGNEPLLALDAIPEIFDELDAVTTAADAATRRTGTRPSLAVVPEAGSERVATRKGIVAPERCAVAQPPALPEQLAAPAGPGPGPAIESLGLHIDLAEWDRTPTETDLPPASQRAPTHDVLPSVPEPDEPPASIEESMLEIIELGTTAGDVAAAGQPTFLPLGTPGPPDPLPLQLPTFDLPAGLVWPGVTGRSALASLTPPVTVTTVPVSWAPGHAIELACGEGWLAHTGPGLWFTDLDDARRTLLDTIRWQARMGALTPSGRTYALAPQSDGARLWILTPVRRTVWSAIEDAFRRGDRATAGWLARRGLETVDEIRAHGAAIGDLDHIALDEPPRLLTTPWTPRSDQLTAQLQRLFTEAIL
jgi:signal recognition particle receptor subunit beta